MKAYLVESVEGLNEFLKKNKEKIKEVKYHPTLLRVTTESNSNKVEATFNDRFVVLTE